MAKPPPVRELARQAQDHVFDREDPADATVLENPNLVLGALRRLLVLDQGQRPPQLFRVLRGLLDAPDSATAE
jgi:hypothetical protein